MWKMNRSKLLAVAGLGLILSAQTGCQTQIAGMTLPTGHYLEHPPQYFPQDPDFPLTKELADQEEKAGLLRTRDGVLPAGGAVAPVPGAAGPAQPLPKAEIPPMTGS
ncbi:hypothetical protein KIH39_07195 [Telmatocola sphagniphila]|jgi:hypothetical protein|uniref:DUF3035 domain-containing protein n=1 Tax=Telmatocola sphagniphila TaxID=1123043 RepID=A0A8E6B884_9BACT|nr:hypothetical protein [Telmatocola sphagniphila]QVL33687.1 hypothetical protein KIH39_07195 [Telmatocola sphagniphila]